MLLLLACAADSTLDDRAAAPSSARVMEEGTAEALGVIAMLNDTSTTSAVLDVDAALDKRAAEGIIAHRDGKDGKAGTKDDDLFGSVQEIDDIKWVGDSALSALLAFATAEGWVKTGEDYYGTIETVTFTKTEADAIVALANTASEATLDVDVSLDSRAAKNLVADRPFASLEEVAAVKYVGATALLALRDWVDAHPEATGGDILGTADAVAALSADVVGLWFTSESDYPLVVWQIADPSTTAVTTSNVKSLIAPTYTARAETMALADRTVEASDMAWMFDRYTVEQDWWEDYNREQAPAWQVVRAVFETQLQDVSVWRIGPYNAYSGLSGDIDVYVIGVTADGDLVGISTVSIET